MNITKVGNNLYIARGFYLGRFFSARGITQYESIKAMFEAIAIYRSVIAWK